MVGTWLWRLLEDHAIGNQIGNWEIWDWRLLEIGGCRWVHRRRDAPRAGEGVRRSLGPSERQQRAAGATENLSENVVPYIEHRVVLVVNGPYRTDRRVER